MRPPSSRRLVGLTALAVGLAALVGITDDRPRTLARPLVAPGLRPDDLASLSLSIAGGPPLVVELTAERAPRITAPAPGLADEVAVRDLVSAIATARLDRLGDRAAWRRAGLDAPRAVVRLRERGGRARELRVGAAVVATGQTWLGVDGRAGLAPSWVAEALVRDPDSLRRTRPFPVGVAPAALELHGPDVELVLAGAPLARLAAGARVALDPARRARLLAAVEGLRVRSAGGTPDGPAVVTVRSPVGADAAELTIHGACPGRPGLRAADGTLGPGCVDGAAVDELLAAGRGLLGDDAVAAAPLERFERTAVAALELTGPPAVRLEPDGAGWRLVVDGAAAPADSAALAALARALTAPATRRPATAADRGEAWRLLRPGGDDEAWEVRRGPGEVTVHRAGEPVTLVLSPDAAAAVRAVGPGLRDRTLATIDPVTVAAITATGVAPARLARGALLDEWLVQAPARATPAPAIAALVQRLAGLRAEAWLPALGGPPRRTLALTVEEPGAPPRITSIEVGPRRPDGCAARLVGGQPALLSPADCAVLLAPLTVEPGR